MSVCFCDMREGFSLISGILFVLYGFVGQDLTQDKYRPKTDYAENYESKITQSIAPLLSGSVLGRPHQGQNHKEEKMFHGLSVKNIGNF